VQPGIGTYNGHQFLTRTVSTLASAIDQGVAIHLSDHAKDGYVFSTSSCLLLRVFDSYQFIMRNYRSVPPTRYLLYNLKVLNHLQER
jgi:hypothetical protein